MGNEIFEKIKKKYEKSKNLSYFQEDSFYVDKSFFEDMGKLIQIIETMNKRKLQDMTFEYFNDYELKTIVGQYLEDFLKEIIKKDYISKNKIKAKIEELERLSNNITIQPQIYPHIIEVLQSLLEKEE